MNYRKNLNLIFSALAIIIFFSACMSTTRIESIPSNAKLYINGEFVGNTPYTYSDKKISGTRQEVKLIKEGFEPYTDEFSRNQKLEPKALYFGIFLVPLFWLKEYNEVQIFDLNTAGKKIAEPQILFEKTTDTGEPTQEDRLRDLQFRYDNKFIDKKTYDREKKRILEEGQR